MLLNGTFLQYLADLIQERIYLILYFLYNLCHVRLCTLCQLNLRNCVRAL